MMRWGTLVSVIIAGTLVGGLLWWPPGAPPDRYSDLGTAMVGALVGGSVIALAVVFLERRYAAEADKRNLQTTLGMGNSFVGIDLSGRNLSGFYLAGRDFSGGKFEGSDLSGANLSGTNLSWARLAGADLRGAKLSKTSLKPDEYLELSVGLKPGTIAPGGTYLRDATTQSINIKEAKYNTSTEWPENFDPMKVKAVFVEDRPPWWRRFFGL